MKNDFLDYSESLEHSTGKWKNHKYLRVENGRYIYENAKGNVQKEANKITGKTKDAYKVVMKKAGDAKDAVKDKIGFDEEKDYYDKLEKSAKLLDEKGHDSADYRTASRLTRDARIAYEKTPLSTARELQYTADYLKNSLKDKAKDAKDEAKNVAEYVIDGLKEKSGITKRKDSKEADAYNEEVRENGEADPVHEDPNGWIGIGGKRYSGSGGVYDGKTGKMYTESERAQQFAKDLREDYDNSPLGKLENAKKKVDSAATKAKTLAKYDALKAKDALDYLKKKVKK